MAPLAHCGVCQRKTATPSRDACHKCDFITCRTCARKWCEAHIRPECPSCHATWPRLELVARLGKTYIHGRSHRLCRGKLLRLRAQPLMVWLAPRTDLERRRGEIRLERSNLRRSIQWIRYKIQHPTLWIPGEIAMRAVHRRTEADDDLWTAELGRLRRELRELNASRSIQSTCRVENCAACGLPNVCSTDDGTVVCSRCGVNTCCRCGLSADSPEHRCDPGDVASREWVERECQACPVCGVRTECAGCATALCPVCQTPWNVTNREVVQLLPDRPEHAPFLHLHRIMPAHRIPGESPEVEHCFPVGPCDGVPHPQPLEDELMESVFATGLVDPCRKWIVVLATFLKTAHKVCAYYKARAASQEQLMRYEACYRYMMNRITSDRLNCLLDLADRSGEFYNEVAQVMEGLLHTFNDLVHRLLSDASRHSEIMAEAECAKRLFSDELWQLQSIYNITAPMPVRRFQWFLGRIPAAHEQWFAE